ncbi:M23 family metallopeptidase [Breoghania sp. L-A4]|uniref:M23 family metallopeptidase n=1 Tax=Breoghania sp. L-A4 TaxID=2304600 RepID=UPI000E35A168|nr:M23 family metallopeptidase [Breoghania sp. L-A4]AXS40833.1 M23 family peptidase [Breoghania sp. L-A4]
MTFERLTIGKMHKNTSAPPSGTRNEPHRVFITRGEQVRCFTIRPWLMGIALSVVTVIAAGYLAATGYLIYRDQLIETASGVNDDVRTAYEDRIAELRVQNDRITSRQILDQKAYQEKIRLLLARQEHLDERQDRVTAIIDKAAKSGLALALAPLPSAKPSLTATPKATAILIDSPQPAQPVAGLDGLGGETLLLHDRGTGPLGLRGSVSNHLPPVPAPEQPSWATGDSAADLAVMDQVSSTLGTMDRQTMAVLDAIAVSAERRIGRIEDVTAPLGIDLADTDAQASGGPFIPFNPDSFDARAERADRAIDRLGALRRAIDTLPLTQPVPRAPTTSRYGQRMDPFLGRAAMHTGIDFKAEYGSAVRATAAGTVVSAGRNGGYGLMVEIDHGNGLTTRYAHLSRIRVAKGTSVQAGKIVGSVGSSGRSTGPHLHYETRLHGAPRNPSTFLDVGTRLSAALQ